MPCPPLHRVLPACAALLALAACASDPPPSPVASAVRPGASPEPMAGRWVLAAVGARQCNVTLSGAPNDFEGTIAPEGGCPGSFFTSRKWTFEQGSLVIRDHTGAPLAQLTQSVPGRFEGKATAGQQITLSR